MTQSGSAATAFASRQFTGLTVVEAQRRLRQDGPNELTRAPGHGLCHTAVEVLRERMILLLLFAGGLYLFLGDHEEAILLLASIGLIIAIELYQERRTEHALEALRDLSSPRALVIRDGEHRRIAGREVVRDDLLILGEGDRVPADAMLLWCTNLSTDESLLTGESVPVRKSARAVSDEVARPGGDDLPYVYSGTLITSGRELGACWPRARARKWTHRHGATDTGERAHPSATGDRPHG